MKFFILLGLSLFLVYLTDIVAADHIEYCRVEVREIFVEQNVSSGVRDMFCSNDVMRVKAVVSMTGLIQVPAEVKLYNDEGLVETQTVNPFGNYYVVTFSNSMPTDRIPRDPQINITISAGCDPTPDNMAINYTITDCPASTASYVAKYEKIPACTPSYTDDYRCFDNWMQRLRQNSDCSYSWLDWQYCNYGCFGVNCLQKPSEEQLQKMEEEQEKVAQTEQEAPISQPTGIYILIPLIVAVVISLLAYQNAYVTYRFRRIPESF